MTQGFNKREPINTVGIHQHPPVVENFTRHNLMGFFERMRGYDDEVENTFLSHSYPSLEPMPLLW